jgi:catechol 2,3-dioxygenase-like lactoylglutathione lyase family enzyme
MPKIRHIAFRSEDVEAMATFFTEAFEMTIAQRRQNGAIDLSDGTMNITLLPMRPTTSDGRQARPGIDHMGFTVEDVDEARERLVAAGGKELQTIGAGAAHFEVKFGGPEGIVVDIGNWAGTEPLASESLADSPADALSTREPSSVSA